MKQYTNYCTEEQTNRAIQLGCPCESPEDYNPIKLPTTQQMLGWLRDKGFRIGIFPYIDGEYSPIIGYGIMTDETIGAMEYEQAELAAIDLALDYLEANAE